MNIKRDGIQQSIMGLQQQPTQAQNLTQPHYIPQAHNVALAAPEVMAADELESSSGSGEELCLNRHDAQYTGNGTDLLQEGLVHFALCSCKCCLTGICTGTTMVKGALG